MQECLLDRDHEADLWHTAADGAWAQQALIVGDASGAVDAQRLVHAGHQEKHADARIDEQVGHGIEPVVADAIGQEQRALIEHAHEARGVATRGNIGAAGPLRGDHAERRQGQHAAAMGVERAQHLVRCAAHRCVMQGTQCALVRDEARVAWQYARGSRPGFRSH
jgi:hypothetical protein